MTIEADLAALAKRQVFFVGGAPRSGTTWVQRLLDAHPEVCCAGEGLFMMNLAQPLDALMEARGKAIAEKNAKLFRGEGGYALPAAEDTDFLLRTAILLALRRQPGWRDSRAVGEKTPENVFMFPRLLSLFPGAKFIVIARDPRDVLTSAWHFFHGPRPGVDEAAAKTAFVRAALPALDSGGRAIAAFARAHQADCRVITYEGLHASPEKVAASLFRLLGVSDAPEVAADCVARTRFASLAAGQKEGGGPKFLRKGVTGDWRSTLSPAMAAMVVEGLGWMYPVFGWEK
jgi:hypothetical protein